MLVDERDDDGDDDDDDDDDEKKGTRKEGEGRKWQRYDSYVLCVFMLKWQRVIKDII